MDTQTKKITTLYMPKDVYAKLLELAKKHRRSFNSEIVWLMEQEIQREEKLQPTQEKDK